MLACPEGPPLIFLAPKQSTYQLERQLLDTGDLNGYSRLHILSFERLARFVFDTLGAPMPKFLSEQGRTMVLRALLTKLEPELSIFRGAARRLGFAEEVSKQIREFRNHGLAPEQLRQIASRIKTGHSAREKLLDLAFVYERYNTWLAHEHLQDGDALLTAATELLNESNDQALEIGGIWFDGFAQLTPQELQFLLAVLRFTPRATLAFCIDRAARADSRISASFLVNQTFGRCRSAIQHHYKSAVLIEKDLVRDATHSRFANCASLRHLEQYWLAPEPASSELASAIRLIEAADPEGEAIFVAREITRHVQAGGRYREVALLLRDLQNDYPHVLRRVFQRYEIPFFLDHRESVAHHPIAELTRGALRTVAFNWKHHDWFATLKCGLVRASGEELDELENAALEHGWTGAKWFEGFTLPKDQKREQRLNQLREKLVKPFAAFANSIGHRPYSHELTAAMRLLWTALRVQEQLEEWSKAEPDSALHSTVWKQMESWLEDIDLAFAGQQVALADWINIMEAGLRGLTVGVVPPVLDQVLIGTVDRSRNPDLKTLYVLGVNERVFPAALSSGTLVTEDDRDALCDIGCSLGDLPSAQFAAEQFYGYIACTRPREKLVLTYARTTMDGSPLNPSRFATHLQRLFPSLTAESFVSPQSISEVVHKSELSALGVRTNLAAPQLVIEENGTLDWGLAEKLYGNELPLSVSALERFAACPFKFFLEYGLRARERKEFLLDVREQGTFQHLVLSKFHEELAAEGLKWRDITPDQARVRVERIADAIIPTFENGLLESTAENRFTAATYKSALQDLMAVLIDWCRTNRFDAEAVEFGFGRDGSVPAWRIPVDAKHAVVLYGRVDRIDLHRVSESEALCVVFDYKSGLQSPNRTLLHHGVQQQLPAYLLTLASMREVAQQFNVKKITPAGCFLLPFRSKQAAQKTRREALDEKQTAVRDGYMHEGLFDVRHLNLFDTGAPAKKSGQFKYNVRKSGVPHSRSFNALKSEAFAALLARSEELIRDSAKRIYSGDISILPYKHGTKTPCERCDYQAVCRFDPWTQPYNILRDPTAAEAGDE